jgi:hypothetical protein
MPFDNERKVGQVVGDESYRAPVIIGASPNFVDEKGLGAAA